jgi:hypothetical protein
MIFHLSSEAKCNLIVRDKGGHFGNFNSTAEDSTAEDLFS